MRRSNLKTEVLSKKDLELKFGNSQSIHIIKKQEPCSEANIRSVAKQLFDKVISVSVNQALRIPGGRPQF